MQLEVSSEQLLRHLSYFEGFISGGGADPPVGRILLGVPAPSYDPRQLVLDSAPGHTVRRTSGHKTIK